MLLVEPTGKGEERGSVCEHFQRAAEILGRRWNPQIIRVLLFGPARFGEIRERVHGISDNLLSERLKQLEAEGIVSRTVGTGSGGVVSNSNASSGVMLVVSSNVPARNSPSTPLRRSSHFETRPHRTTPCSWRVSTISDPLCPSRTSKVTASCGPDASWHQP